MSEKAKFKVQSRTPRTEGGMKLGCALPFGGVFAVTGIFIILRALNIITEGDVHAPMWLLGSIGILFAGAGLFVIGMGFKESLRLRRLKALAAKHPDEPWFGDYHWNPEGIRAETTSLKSALTGLFFVGGLMIPFNWWAWLSGDAPTPVVLIVILFDLILLGIIIHLVITVMRRIKYGVPEIHFNSFPFFQGEMLDITLVPVKNLDTFKKLTIRLECLEEHIETRHRNRGGRSSSETKRVCKSVHETEQIIEGPGRFNALGDGLRIPMPIPMEGNCTRLKEMPITYWYIHIIADTPGVDFKTHFLVPIYQR